MPDLLQRIADIIRRELPGEDAHRHMIPTHRTLSSVARESAAGIRESSVAVVLFRSDTGYRCILIQRPQYEGNHSGQISFPGGKRESTDPDAEYTAVRECMEEIGLDLTEARLLGKLTSVYIPVSNFNVEPFLYFFPGTPSFSPDAREVDSILTISLQELLDDGNIHRVDIDIAPGAKLRSVPVFLLEDKQIWGATALVLSELREILRLTGTE